MTLVGQKNPRTTTDLLFGPGADASEALAKQILPANANLDHALKHLPQPTRDAAVHEAATDAAALLDADLLGLLVAGWRAHHELADAARRTLAVSGSTELVDLIKHQITTTQQPSVSVLVDGDQIATLRFALSVVFDISTVVAAIKAGLLTAIHAGTCDITATLNFQGTDMITTHTRLDLPGLVKLGTGIRLLPDDSDARQLAAGQPDTGRDTQTAGKPPRSAEDREVVSRGRRGARGVKRCHRYGASTRRQSAQEVNRGPRAVRL
jgi:hypothetical protein